MFSYDANLKECATKTLNSMTLTTFPGDKPDVTGAVHATSFPTDSDMRKKKYSFVKKSA